MEKAVYPNPARSVVHLVQPEAIRSIAIFSLSGQLLETPQPASILDISKLSKGIYILKLITHDGNSRVERLMIQD
jgi:hypothetical protein